MELWLSIAQAPYPRYWLFVAIAALVGVIGSIVVTFRAINKRDAATKALPSLKGKELFAHATVHRHVRRLQWASATVVVSLFVLAFGTLWAVGVSQEAHKAAIADAVADYLYEEYDLVPLNPITVESRIQEGSIPKGAGTAHTTAVQEGGTLVDATVSWLSVDSTPRNADWVLPEGFDPIVVTIAPVGK